ncbi:MAG: hypothetical protein CMH59_19945, partial [Myxococcales bacterium]|nr:hypothetical protein [Myxococcales bacterium]
MTRPPEEELDRLDETHLDEEAEEASRRVRHAPRFQRVRRPETGAQPGSAAWQARLAALATPASEGFAVDLVRSGGPRVASLDGDPLVALDAGEGVLRSPRGYQPGPAVRAHAEGGFGAALTGDDGVRARAEEAAFAAWLRARSPEHPHVAFLPSVATARDLALTAAQRLRPEAPLALALEGGAELGVPVERHGAPASIPGEAPVAPAGWAEAAGRGELGAFADAPGLGETVRALEAIDARLGARPDVYAVHVEPLQEATERWLGPAFLAGLRAVAARRRVALIVDEVGGGFGAGAVGQLALHAEAMVGLAPPELVVFGGAAQVGVVVGVDPLPPARDRAHPAALFRGRLAAEALGRHASDLEGAVRERLERLAGRFAIVSGVRAAGRAFAFELPTEAHVAALRAQAPARGALPLAGSEAAPRTVRYRLGERWGERELDALFDALRATLKYLEARLDAAGAGPPWEPEPPPPKAARRPPIDAPTRVRAVPPGEAEAMLDAVVGLEARVYEPARRDSKEKLGLAFRDPAGVAVVAEAERDGAWELVGCALGAPLERIEGV